MMHVKDITSYCASLTMVCIPTITADQIRSDPRIFISYISKRKKVKWQLAWLNQFMAFRKASRLSQTRFRFLLIGLAHFIQTGPKKVRFCRNNDGSIFF